MIDLERVNGIVELSQKLGNTPEEIIGMMEHHTSEIKDLYEKNDLHFAIETGDLIILAFHLLMMEGRPLAQIMGECYGRFEKKLKSILENKSG